VRLIEMWGGVGIDGRIYVTGFRSWRKYSACKMWSIENKLECYMTRSNLYLSNLLLNKKVIGYQKKSDEIPFDVTNLQKDLLARW